MEFVNDFQDQSYSMRKLCLYTKGEMRIIQKGATALIFTFKIHSDGYHTTAIKVNNKLVPMGL